MEECYDQKGDSKLLDNHIKHHTALSTNDGQWIFQIFWNLILIQMAEMMLVWSGFDPKVLMELLSESDVGYQPQARVCQFWCQNSHHLFWEPTSGAGYFGRTAHCSDRSSLYNDALVRLTDTGTNPFFFWFSFKPPLNIRHYSAIFATHSDTHSISIQGFYTSPKLFFHIISIVRCSLPPTTQRYQSQSIHPLTTLHLSRMVHCPIYTPTPESTKRLSHQTICIVRLKVTKYWRTCHVNPILICHVSLCWMSFMSCWMKKWFCMLGYINWSFWYLIGEDEECAQTKSNSQSSGENHISQQIMFKVFAWIFPSEDIHSNQQISNDKVATSNDVGDELRKVRHRNQMSRFAAEKVAGFQKSLMRFLHFQRSLRPLRLLNFSPFSL